MELSLWKSRGCYALAAEKTVPVIIDVATSLGIDIPLSHFLVWYTVLSSSQDVL